MKFLLHTQIGAEKIALEELESKFKGKYSLDYTAFVPNKNGLIQVEWQDESTSSDFFHQLSCIDDAFLILDYLNNIPEKSSIQQMYPKIDVKNIEKNLDFFYKTYFPKLKRDEREIRFISRKKSNNPFLRSDLHESMHKLFQNNFRHITIKDEESSQQIWTTLIKNRLIAAIRLHKINTDYLNPNLKNSTAACISYISQIKSSDSIWIAYCDSGVIGCEIIKNHKFKKLILSDSFSEEDLNICKENLEKTDNFNKNKGKISVRNEDFFNSKNYSDILIAQPKFSKDELVNKEFIQKFFNKIRNIHQIKKLVLLYPAIVETPDWLLFKNYQLRVNGVRMNLLVYQRQS